MIFQKNLYNSGEVRLFRPLIVEFVEHEPRSPLGADEDASIDVRRHGPVRLHLFQRQCWFRAADHPRLRDKASHGLRGGDLSGQNLLKADLAGADLSNANLSGADLRGADLYRADLSGADLSNANLSNAILNRSDLSGANLSGTDLTAAQIRAADMSRANLTGADLRRVELTYTNLTGVTWVDGRTCAEGSSGDCK